MIFSTDAFANITLSPDEKQQLRKLEAAAESIIREKFEGLPIKLTFNEPVSPRVAYALKYSCEIAGWRVMLDLKPALLSLGLIPQAVVQSVTPQAITVPEVLPPLVRIKSLSSIGPRLLVRMPTRGRPRQALDVLTKYRQMAGIPITIEVILDEDDKEMLSAEVLQRLCALHCVITVGNHKSKIEAVNGGYVEEWDILLNASDDMWPVVNGYAIRVIEEMEKHWPYLDGAIFFGDGYAGDRCCTLSILGRRLYDQFGYVYEPEYISLFSDQEQTNVLNKLGRLIYIDQKIIEHRHPATGTVSSDSLYARNDAFWVIDQETYERRKTENPPPQLSLSIGICTIPERAEQLALLLDHLYSQIIDYAPREVEILVDGGEGTIGAKRQRLLERARGNYICYVDDDDWLSHDYIKKIIDIVCDSHEDCVSIPAVMTTSGTAPEPVKFSVTYDEDHSKEGVHYRRPNHLCPIRRELALKVGFESISHAEDYNYAKGLQSLIDKEVRLEGDPLYFYFYNPTKGNKP